jgi:methylated-DNA-[protein]-cysteine S-methyltransferase
MKKSSFSERCYEILRTVPRGKVTTYKALAQALGTRAYRAVGSAMRCNPYAPQVPCHRVVCSDGNIGGYSGGLAKKIALLKGEGIEVLEGKVQDLKHVLVRPKRRHR